jgi:hypothetical protein
MTRHYADVTAAALLRLTPSSAANSASVRSPRLGYRVLLLEATVVVKHARRRARVRKAVAWCEGVPASSLVLWFPTGTSSRTAVSDVVVLPMSRPQSIL